MIIFEMVGISACVQMRIWARRDSSCLVPSVKIMKDEKRSFKKYNSYLM